MSVVPPVLRRPVNERLMRVCSEAENDSSKAPASGAFDRLRPAQVGRLLRARKRRSREYFRVALVGFRGGATGSRNQACDKGAEQGSPAPARIVNELEEPEIVRQ